METTKMPATKMTATRMTASKAHAAGVVTAGSALAVAWLTGSIEAHTVEAFGAALAVAAAGWLGTWLAPANRDKGDGR